MTSLNESSAKLLILEEKAKGAAERIDKHEIRIDRLEESVPLLSRLETILEMQVEINRNQGVSIENQNKQSEKTFQAITQNLTQLNMTTELLKESFTSVQNKIDKVDKNSDDALQEVKAKLETEINKKKIDTADWGVKIFYGAVMLIPPLVTAWIMAQNNW